ncbi:MAG: HlyD family efflux transporter periplasmic adaptor subunit [Dysgonamonadaceae bacterium]|jgi:HlyD family secretion protein|nr:HlyD family efflux transporter periplasmic adaptor subunit [Dysgonamonadaceae bacterium]
MKTSKFFVTGIVAVILSSCGNGNGTYDASGVFEATEVIVSAKTTGEIMQFDIEEGQQVEAGKQMGCIDTLQLYLKKMQLLANMKSVESRHYNVSRQIASIRQQIATQKTEQKRYENLVKSNAGNQKQLDDIHAQIALLEKQLSAQTETLENNNKSVLAESSGLEMQVAQIEDQIQKSIISSPINGTVLSKYAEQGELASQGRTLFKVADIENMKLRAYITADQLTSLKIGQQVKVYSDRGKSDRNEYPGTITWISDKAEFTPKTIQTRNERANLVYAVKIAVKNDGYIKKGMYGEIKINEQKP